MIAGISVIALIWVKWLDYQPSPFGITPMAPYLVLVTILTGRVHRNTKLGLYNMDSQQSNDPKSQPHTVAYSTLLRNSHPAAKPIQRVDTDIDVYSLRSDYSTTSTRGHSLDFGMV